jgi:hypothetical protein
MVEIEDDDTKTPCQVILSICHKTNSSSLTLSELMSEFKEVLKAKILWMMILLRPSFIFLSSSLSLHFTAQEVFGSMFCACLDYVSNVNNYDMACPPNTCNFTPRIGKDRLSFVYFLLV